MTVGDMSTFYVIVAEAQLFNEGNSQMLAGLDRLFWHVLRRIGVRSTSCALYCKSCKKSMHSTMHSQVRL